MTTLTLNNVNPNVFGSLTNISYKPISGGTAPEQFYRMWDEHNSQSMAATQGISAADGYDIKRSTSNGKWHDNGTNLPAQFEVSSSTTQSSPQTSSGWTNTPDSTDKYLHIYAANGVFIGYLDVWTPFQSSGSGPTITNITCSNQNSGTRTIDVTGSGTLTASDITYYINTNDIQTLSSPNNGVHNIQTTSTGWTFDSYTSTKTGLHRIEIGTKSLTFLVNTSTLSTDSSQLLTNYGITHTWPTLTEWNTIFQNYTEPFDDVSQTATRVYMSGEKYSTNVEELVNLEYLEWIQISKICLAGSGYKLEWWCHDYTGTTRVVTNQTHYLDPIAYHQANNDPEPHVALNGSGHLPTVTLDQGYNFIQMFKLKNLTYTAPPPTSSTDNTSGTPRDGYPIVMTNLFNRVRSIYSIGMTHKTARDPFL